MKKHQITIYEITGETDPICLQQALDYFVRKFQRQNNRRKK